MKTIFCLFFLSIVTLSYGQFKAPKFGKIDPSELSMTRYDKDTAAGALILFDDGYSYFQTTTEGNFQVLFERHCRIKLFKKSAFDLANVNIKLYKSSTGGKEVLSSLKAATFNAESGKMVQIKVEDKNIFEEKAKNYTIKKLAFPQIKEGSIIEFSYCITSDFLYNLRGWVFHHSYPAVWSQYETRIPEYFEYRQSSKGYLGFTLNKEDQSSTTFTYYESTNQGESGSRRESNTIHAIIKNHLYAISDVPAFKSEPNIDCEDNYIQSIEFELSSIQFPGSNRRTYTESWESVNRKLTEDEDFGQLLKATGFIKDTVKLLCKNKTSDLEKASAIYSYVQKRMKWNGNYSIWAYNGLKKAYKEHTGNSAHINLLLTVMLQCADLDASPVLFSTRDNGIAISIYPTISKYNSVLTKLLIDGKSYLLDACSEFNPMGVLPANDINGTGRIINNEKSDMVDLETNTFYKEAKTYRLKINSDGTFTGIILSSNDGYAAILYRDALSKVKNNDELIRKMQENIKGLSINGYEISNRNNVDEPLNDSLNVTIKDNAEVIGNKIIFTPLLYEATEKNIYKLEDRKYPVNYNYPISEACIFEYTIPEGYQVESLPKSVKFKLPDNSISMSYMIQSQGEKIFVVYKKVINKMLFVPDEYQDLKEFYNQIVKTHSEKIILKKI
jgi:hypothetical protein